MTQSLYVCNKCGYNGPESRHAGCNYLAAPAPDLATLDAEFHRLWTWAVGLPGYDKAAWSQCYNHLRSLIEGCETLGFVARAAMDTARLEMLREARRALNLFDGAMPQAPAELWQTTLAIMRLRTERVNQQ